MDTPVYFPLKNPAKLYDPASGRLSAAPMEGKALWLMPNTARFVTFGEASRASAPPKALDCRHAEPLNGAWLLSCTSAERYPMFMSMEFPGLVNLSAPDLLLDLSGIFCYELTFDRPRQGPACWKLAEAMANGHVLPKMVTLPYLAELPDGLLQAKAHRLIIEVTNACHGNPYDG